MAEVEVRRNRAEHRYEIFDDGVLAGHLEYRVRGDVVVVPHTEILPGFEGRGLASVLVGEALADITKVGFLIEPECTYVQAWIKKNPDYEDFVADPEDAGAED